MEKTGGRKSRDTLPLNNMGCIRIRNFCLDPDLDPDPELGKFRAGSGSGINHSGPTALVQRDRIFFYLYNQFLRIELICAPFTKENGF